MFKLLLFFALIIQSSISFSQPMIKPSFQLNIGAGVDMNYGGIGIEALLPYKNYKLRSQIAFGSSRFFQCMDWGTEDIWCGTALSSALFYDFGRLEAGLGGYYLRIPEGNKMGISAHLVHDFGNQDGFVVSYSLSSLFISGGGCIAMGNGCSGGGFVPAPGVKLGYKF